MPKKILPGQPIETPAPGKIPGVKPVDPDELIIPEEDPDIIPEEDPFESPPPFEKPAPGEGP